MSLILGTPKIAQHPFKEGVLGLLGMHFAPDIVKNFVLSFEAETFNWKEAQNVWKQVKDGNFVMEVRYRNPDNTTEYICDVKSWESRSQTEATLLRNVTDAYIANRIGLNWEQKGEMIGVSKQVSSGDFMTPIQIGEDLKGKKLPKRKKK